MNEAAGTYGLCEARAAGSGESDGGACDGGGAEPVLNMVRLVRTIEADLVPRLLLAQRHASPPIPLRTARTAVTNEDVAAFVQLLMDQHVSVAGTFVGALEQRGATWTELCLRLMMPAARRLGELWEQDRCDFLQVTLGLSKLHRLLHDLIRRLDEDAPLAAKRGGSPTALFASVPGEQHTFGVIMVGHFFRRTGWDVCTEIPSDHDDLIRLVQNTYFDLVGLSLGSEVNIPVLAKAIRAVRRASLNKSVTVMAGGPVLAARPQLVAEVGADATAVDGAEAVRIGDQIRAARSAQR